MPALYRSVIVVGCGPHYRKRYHAVLDNEQIKIALAIDLQAEKETILDFFAHQNLQPASTLFIDNSFRNDISAEIIDSLIAGKAELKEVDAVLLCTEPKVRKPYALWAIQHRLHIFMDKPPCAFSKIEKMDTLLLDFEEMVSASQKAHVRIVVSCERRAHFGYVWLKKYLGTFIKEEQAPITSIDIHFANGNRITPHEYASQEQHPFKYGYGLLLHSGYHYVDLLVSLLSLNSADEWEYSLKVIANQGRGETDFLLIGEAISHDQQRTLISLKLLNTSLSRRIDTQPSAEAPWRMRQEHLIIHLGYLASLNVRSNPLKKLDPKSYSGDDFNITLMHSPLLKGRAPIKQMDRKQITRPYPLFPPEASLNQYAREWQLREFLHGRDGNSPLISHRNTMQLTALIYSQLLVMSQGRVR